MHHHLGALTVEEVHLCRGPEGKNKCFSNSSTATLENVLRGEKKVQPFQLCLHRTYSSTQNVGPGGAGVYKTTQKNKTNQLLGSPLTDEPEKQETDKWREQLQPHSR